MCTKTPYSKKEARTVMNDRTTGRRRMRHGRPKFLRIYECPECRAWHLTHEPRRGDGETRRRGEISHGLPLSVSPPLQ